MKSPLHTLLILPAILLNIGLLSAQDPDQSIRIDNSMADTVYYCNAPVAVAPDIVIENYVVEKPSDGIKISIANYVPGEDLLFYTGSDFIPNWDADLGNLELTGQGTAEELEAAVRQVFYDNTSVDPASGLRSISVSLIDADYLPETQHFYQYIPNIDITWTEAKAAAENMDYYGLQGYLATIMSEVENDFIWSKIDGLGWIGATDEGDEGNWRWDTGPEAGTLFWEGGGSGQPVDGHYSNWSAGEPNNLGGEHYAHINQDPFLEEKSWNDLKLGGDRVEGSYYRVQGFVVEFGGMPDDPDVQLSTSAVIGINLRQEVLAINYDSVVCGDLQHELDIQIEQGVSVTLRPIDPNSSVVNESSLNPTVMVQEHGRYRFELETNTENQCKWSDTIEISFQHQPVARLNIDEADCIDSDLRLFFTGNVEGDAFYEWYINDTINDSGVNLDSLEIILANFVSISTVGLKINENGCFDSVQIPVTVKSTFEIQADNPEGCTPLEVQFNSSATEDAGEFFWSFGSENTSTLTEPVYTFVNPDTTDQTFDVSLTVISAEGCVSSHNIENMIRVHPVPTVDIGFDETVCYDGTEEIWYTGNAGPRDTFLWDLSDLQPENIIKHPGVDTGPLQFNLPGKPSAEIGLQVVSEYGCKSDTLMKTYKRIPVFSLSEDTLKGCPPFNATLSVLTDDNTDQVDYFWDLGNGQTAQGNPVLPVYSQENQVFDVSVYAVSSLTGCANTLLFPGKIAVHPVPEASFTASPTSVLVSDPEVHFENTSRNANMYEWDFGDNSFGSGLENPVHRYENIGLFDVSLVAYNRFGCVDSAFSQVAVAFDKVFPPTAFSPNAASEEDREFRIYAEGIVNEGYKLLIFNRWGEVIFTSNSPEVGWDGKMDNGSNAPAGAYFWVLEYFDLVGKEHAQNGSLTLLY